MDIIKKANFNLRESIKDIGKNSPKGEIIEKEDLLLSTVGLNTTESHANAAFSLDNSNPERVFKKADKFFKERNSDYIFWVGATSGSPVGETSGLPPTIENYLKELGYEPSREPGTPLMVIDHKLDLPNLDIEIEVKKVESQREIDDFIEVADKCFEIGEEVAKAMFNAPEVLNGKNSAAYLLYHNNKAVSAVQIYKTGDIAGIYWVATLEEMRGKGLGKYISALGTNKAFDMGAKKIILQASRLGQYVYERIGYDLIGYYRTYKILANKGQA